MKKFLAILVVIVIFISTMSVFSFAYAPEKEFDLSEYQMEDLLTMSSVEFQNLLADFERVYDPFGTFTIEPLAQNNKNEQNQIQPYWTSGGNQIINWDVVYVEGTHELMTARACALLYQEKGFFSDNDIGSMIFTLEFCLASVKPDKFLTGWGQLFAGHFYDPDTEMNYLGSKIYTGKVNTKKYYDQAIIASNDVYWDTVPAEIDESKVKTLVDSVGCMIHYIQDLCVPHHAANVTSTNPSHTAFEEFTFNNIDLYLNKINYIDNNYYIHSTNIESDALAHEAAYVAKGYIQNVNDIKNKSEWNNTADICVENAVSYTAGLIYKFMVSGGLDWYPKNP